MEAHGRVAVEPVTSKINLPLFDNSAMDGYAVRAEDVAGAKLERPMELRLVGRIGAGQIFEGKVGKGECMRVFTGSALPSGTDAVVMQVDTQVPADQPIR